MLILPLKISFRILNAVRFPFMEPSVVAIGYESTKVKCQCVYLLLLDSPLLAALISFCVCEERAVEDVHRSFSVEVVMAGRGVQRTDVAD